LANSEKCSIAQLSGTKQVCDKPCLLLEVGASPWLSTSYVTPIAHDDPDSQWSSETNAYDDDTDTQAHCAAIGKYLELISSGSLACSKVRVWGHCLKTTPPPVFANPDIDIDVFLAGSGWYNIWSGEIPRDQWVEKEIGFTANMFGARIKWNGVGVALLIKEFDLIEQEALAVSLYNGFDNTDQKKYQIGLSNTGKVFRRFDKPIYFNKGLYVEFDIEVSNIYIRYLITGDKKWSTPQTSQRRKLHIPGLHLCNQLYKLLRDWFTK